MGGSGWWGGQGGCEPRIEGIVQCTKRMSNIKKIKKMCGGGGGGAIFEPKTLSMYLKKKKKNKVK